MAKNIFYKSEDYSSLRGCSRSVFDDGTGTFHKWHEEYHDFPSSRDYDIEGTLELEEVKNIVITEGLADKLTSEGRARLGL